VAFTTLSSDEPALSSACLTARIEPSVCASMSPGMSFPVLGSNGGRPETNRKPLARTTGESGMLSFRIISEKTGISTISLGMTTFPFAVPDTLARLWAREPARNGHSPGLFHLTKIEYITGHPKDFRR
jgi:hypothetical protein